MQRYLSIRGPSAVVRRLDTHDVRSALASTAGSHRQNVCIFVKKTMGHVRFAMRKSKKST